VIYVDPLSAIAFYLRRPGRTRVVSPLPPHAPEPYPDEPFAPAYDYEPLGDGFSGMRVYPPVGDPRWPDRLVFGPEYPRGLTFGDTSVHCYRCDVTWAWAEGAACWCCGRPG
jgi:hypothetical protein